MKSFTVKYFALFREQAGCGEQSVQSQAGSVGELFEELARQHGFDSELQRIKTAVNDEMAQWSTPLEDGDTVLFFPPVSGG